MSNWTPTIAASVESSEAAIAFMEWADAQAWCNFVLFQPRQLPPGLGADPLEGELKIWDMQTGQEVFNLRGHTVGPLQRRYWQLRTNPSPGRTANWRAMRGSRIGSVCIPDIGVTNGNSDTVSI
jgi:hypothetical protein